MWWVVRCGWIFIGVASFTSANIWCCPQNWSEQTPKMQPVSSCLCSVLEIKTFVCFLLRPHGRRQTASAACPTFQDDTLRLSHAVLVNFTKLFAWLLPWLLPPAIACAALTTCYHMNNAPSHFCSFILKYLALPLFSSLTQIDLEPEHFWTDGVLSVRALLYFYPQSCSCSCLQSLSIICSCCL